MKLILAEYIEALKEDKELDRLIQDILREHGIAIFSEPERGRQYGVDIYAVGKDFEDNGRKKVFLITVKQGDLDRQTWHGDQNALLPSLDEIRTVFIRNNIAPQHRNLPIKIVVAFNGILKQNVQQNWRGYTETNPGYDYALWNSDWLLTQFEAKLLSEEAFSSNTRSQLRKTIIYIENTDYQLEDFSELLSSVSLEFRAAKSKKSKLRILRELQVTVSIILKYAEKADNLMHSIRIVEKYILILWAELCERKGNKDLISALAIAYRTLYETFLKYYHKISFIGRVRDGYSVRTHDSVIYTYTAYEQVGIISMTGLLLLHLNEVFGERDAELQSVTDQKTREIAANLIDTFNNNQILFSPRADEQHIEICLSLILLQKLGLHEEISSLLILFNNQMAAGFAYLNIFPESSNSRRKVAELEVDYEKRIRYNYEASTLFTVLAEWSAITNDETCYNKFFQFRQNLIKDMSLTLWFPEKNTQDLLFTKGASRESGYSLTNIELPSTLEEMRELMRQEYANNCYEKDFSFIKERFWIIGLIASRHYRTYIFPHYWRQFIDIQ